MLGRPKELIFLGVPCGRECHRSMNEGLVRSAERSYGTGLLKPFPATLLPLTSYIIHDFLRTESVMTQSLTPCNIYDLLCAETVIIIAHTLATTGIFICGDGCSVLSCAYKSRFFRVFHTTFDAAPKSNDQPFTEKKLCICGECRILSL